MKALKSKLQRKYSNLISSSSANKATTQLSALAHLEAPFFVIGVPGSLHIVERCLRFIPEMENIIFIANGLTKWENQWAQSNLKVDGMISFGNILKHGAVLDFLFNNFEKPFGILDYDCFVFNPEFFQSMKIIDPGTIVNAIFAYKNHELVLEFPETFFMFFNPHTINLIKKKYKVSCQPYQFDDLSKNVKQRLATIGLENDHYPENNKKYFDTLRLIISLGISDGYKINFIEKFPSVSQPNDIIFHIGGVSQRKSTSSLWNFRGSYLWRRCLEECPDENLQSYYKRVYGDISIKELLESNSVFSGYQSIKEFFDFVEYKIFEIT